MDSQSQLARPIELKFPNQQREVFSTAEGFAEWLSFEIEFWSQYISETYPSKPFDTGGPADTSLAHLQNVVHLAEHLLKEPSNIELISTIEQQFAPYTSESPNAVYSASSDGHLVSALAETNPAASIMLLASLTNYPINFKHATDIRKFTDASISAWLARADRDLCQSAVDDSLSKMNAQWNELSSEFRNKLETADRESGHLEERIDSRIVRSAEFVKRHYAGLRDRRNESFEEMMALESTYKQKLQLEAPATYWGRRRSAHIIIASTCAFVFLASIVLLSMMVIKNFPEILALVPKSSDGSIGVGGLVVVTLPAAAIAWALRIFTRTFVQQSQMANDAAQRETMITTFLALSKEGVGNIGADERILILNAIFRPSEVSGDGDAPPPNLVDLAKSAVKKGP